MPNSLWELAGGEDLFVVMLPLWCNDVSGNKSKQYNKRINIYMVNSNLPGRLLQQEYFVRFVSTSPHATSPEQFAALKEQIRYVHQAHSDVHYQSSLLWFSLTHTDPMHCYNSATNKPCHVILQAQCLPADNPQQSEESSHIGSNANCKCCKCKVGGPHEHTESDEGYHSLHFVCINYNTFLHWQ